MNADELAKNALQLIFGNREEDHRYLKFSDQLFDLEEKTKLPENSGQKDVIFLGSKISYRTYGLISGLTEINITPGTSISDSEDLLDVIYEYAENGCIQYVLTIETGDHSSIIITAYLLSEEQRRFISGL